MLVPTMITPMSRQLGRNLTVTTADIAGTLLYKPQIGSQVMPLQLRQICLVAENLQPVIEDLTEIFGLHPCFIDPNVAAFGLENTLMPVGRNFLEVVAPIQSNTAAGRYLERRNGDGGYMVITQADSKATQMAARKRAQDLGVRIAHEVTREDWHLLQLHPGDLEAAFLEIETDNDNDFTGRWMPVGGRGWEDKVDQTRTLDFVGVALQCTDPKALASKWAEIIGVTPNQEGDDYLVPLNNVDLRFTGLKDERGPGLSAITLAVVDPDAILSAAEQRGYLGTAHHIDIAGIRWHLERES